MNYSILLAFASGNEGLTFALASVILELFNSFLFPFFTLPISLLGGKKILSVFLDTLSINIRILVSGVFSCTVRDSMQYFRLIENVSDVRLRP